MPLGLCSRGMFNLTKKKLPNSQLELTGEIPAEKFMSYWGPAASDIAAQVQIPGFRPGKAPEKQVLDKVGEPAILQEMAERALRDAYLEIVQTEKVDVLGRPEITITKIAKDNPLGFTITTDVYPEITLPDYKKIAGKITATPLVIEEVKEEEVEKIIKDLEAREVKDPEVKKEDWPEKIKTNLAEERKHKAEDKRRLEIMKAITNAMTIDLPAVIIETELDKMLAEMKSDTMRIGLNFEDYLKHLNKTEAELKTGWHDQAIERVKIGLTLNAIAEAEKVVAPADKLEAELTHLKAHYPDADENKMRSYLKSVLENEAVWELLESKN